MVFAVDLLGPKRLKVTCQQGLLVRLDFTDQAPNRNPLPLLQMAQEQLCEYLAGQRRLFTLPLACVGPPFFVKVWRELDALPYGSHLSYAELAAKAGSPKASRAVGNAMKANPLPLLRPCHRILPQGGDAAPGFSFGGPEVQRYLLRLEQSP